jgi:hypothetical protein
MKTLFKTRNVLQSGNTNNCTILFTAVQSNGQQLKPAAAAMRLLMALKFITKYMVRAGLSFCCMVLFIPLR